jgi:hypothetical protein
MRAVSCKEPYTLLPSSVFCIWQLLAVPVLHMQHTIAVTLQTELQPTVHALNVLHEQQYESMLQLTAVSSKEPGICLTFLLSTASAQWLASSRHEHVSCD